MEEKDMIEVKTHRAMIDLPENAIEITVTAMVYEGKKLQEVSKTYDLNDIREMFRKADEGYIDEDDRFVLTDKGREWLDRHDEERMLR